MSSLDPLGSDTPLRPDPSRPASGAGMSPGLSPVDQILAMPPQGRALLDSRPAGEPAPKWMWMLPLVLALPGGIAAWLLLRDSNRGAARAMLVVGVVVTVITVLTFGSTRTLLASLGF